MITIASQITILTIVYSILYSDVAQRKHQSSASLAFVQGIHRWPVNSPHKKPVTRKMFPFDDVIMKKSAQNTFLSQSTRDRLPIYFENENARNHSLLEATSSLMTVEINDCESMLAKCASCDLLTQIIINSMMFARFNGLVSQIWMIFWISNSQSHFSNS